MDLIVRAGIDSYRGLHRIWIPAVLLALISPFFTLSLPLIERYLIDEVVLSGNADGLRNALTLYVGVWLVILLIGIGTGILRNYLGETIALHFRQRLMRQSEHLSVPFSQKEHSGKTVALFTSDLPVLVSMQGSVVFAAITTIVSLVYAIVLMFRLSWELAVIVAIVPPVISGLALIVTRPLRPATRRAQEKTAELTERIQESLAGIRETVAFGQEHAQDARFLETLKQLRHLRMRVAYMDTAYSSGQSFFSLTLTLVILGFGGYLVMQGRTTIGTLFAMRTLFSYMFQSLSQVLTLTSSLQKASASAERVYEFLDRTADVIDQPDARSLNAVSGHLSFEDVSFGYDSSNIVLQHISFTAEPGEVIALVGPSGAGKSTIAALIPRFFDPSEGVVRIDGVDLRQVRLSSLRSQIGIVFQNTFLFAGTVRENIAFGRPAATEHDVIEAAKNSHAWEFIERLPQGLETQVGERGVQLSEGQKQRIAIARALLRDPRILILDEPTSALDARSEHLLQAALDNLMRGRTTLVIAHRLGTVRRADQILVIDDGCIVDRGTHQELLCRPGLYQDLHTLQTGHETNSIPARVLSPEPVPVA